MAAVAILAAGRGTRMKSDLPKVLHQLGGRTLVQRVLESCVQLQPSRRLIIVGYGADLVRDSLQKTDTQPGLEFVEQTEQLGTGHAIQQLLPYLKDFTGDLLVLNGDVPLLRPDTLEQLIKIHTENGNGATLLAAHFPNPTGYGRVFCDSQNLVNQIVEERDCTDAQRQNHRINAGVYCFNWPQLAKILPDLKADNDQQEYYLTDTVHHLDKVMAVDVEDYREILGVNSRKHLANSYRVLQDWVKTDWMAAGVTIIDPDSVTIDDTVKLETDVIIEPQTHLRGNTIIQTGSRIGPGSLIENSQIGKNVTVQFSVVSDSVVADRTRIGPYAHLRGHAKVGEQCRVGNFVELKNTEVGNRTNISHLSYIGDATLGDKVNIGAGTITANYDGVKKHRTTIGDRTKTGANSVLVAPLTLGNDVTVAAGSTITDDVPDDSLAIARERQIIKPGWRLESPE
ncbi:bifunctional UDP-N-acetylglucosamine diphosphorylase/glucosamine-1-phosphate N-acetyltransferase GlmU [Planktothrix agardhii]|jgi:bifunctional UDP-N-acetylglucosamine pyrophosphorylase/glucosamine-1-phosphate N-acetyltransferase|uniref:bifunctional UDP-N-acetylglucosamine diphosphorylase/glucosamine-1-phosphate N-acetyltransferase GlmU n=1 Tax=Planktothrix agardhii TaxID=1160 RepID=UPI001D0B0DFE|nr:bifunctional UDP-N-acetylglucosamine diphosphorylase/glucosamine-1-phosphate N-acetyltransferase GlmU [Planktothrix agardhii]MCF3608080.1 bifunctional UDP-N-acetylglucosamine diphosphorylase/glucosamine-1-phosphate N-acetyltransferase GlmU [Planktothrix agardhii 1033]MCB8752163.1 bifunctional UDP-N-acetylglucosamine diphosphorylase/glucosamine-1-phosphate N-acetyltransferase GlmU [Planktothrix agardhii 1810]MCB8761209.1 bifunctional UDP-N-acetylglucosamine diphosphorylase/glucosamine-1-phosph